MNLENKTIVLASASPRRKEICERLGLKTVICPAETEDEWNESLSPEEASLQIARSKAEAVFRKHPDSVVLGSDTVVLAPGEIVLGKPKSQEDAYKMLSMLSGKTHRVLTSVWVCTPEKQDGFVSENRVSFLPMSDEDMESYIQTGEPMDKAGAYGIQGFGCRYIQRLEGDFHAVMGLPAGELWKFLKNF